MNKNSIGIPQAIAAKQRPFVGRLFERLAEQAGVQVIVEPQYGYVGQIICPNGKIHYFRNTNFDLNPIGASEIAKDKDYANFFMRRLGYPVIPGQTFFSKERCKQLDSPQDIDAAYQYAKELGFPVIIKPNSRSQGTAVCKVYTKKEFYQAASVAFKKDKVILIQRVVTGQDYRIVVLDGEIISAYQRVPLFVVGDGQSSIQELLTRKQQAFHESGRDTQLKLDDFRIQLKLRRMKWDFSSVLASGTMCSLLDNANLSSGGDAIDVTQEMRQDYKQVAIQLTQDMGLRYCGVDLMIEGDIKDPLANYWVIEINAAPGIDNYAASGNVQEGIVENLYLKILEAIKRL